MDTSQQLDLAVAIGTSLLAGAAFYGLWQSRAEAAKDRAHYRQQAEEQREFDRSERNREHTLERVIRILDAYEVMCNTSPSNPVWQQARATVRAQLFALPVRDLQVLRWEVGVYPDERERGRIDSYNAKQLGPDHARAELMAMLERLTGREPEADALSSDGP